MSTPSLDAALAGRYAIEAPSEIRFLYWQQLLTGARNDAKPK